MGQGGSGLGGNVLCSQAGIVLIGEWRVSGSLQDWGDWKSTGIMGLVLTSATRILKLELWCSQGQGVKCSAG